MRPGRWSRVAPSAAPRGRTGWPCQCSRRAARPHGVSMSQRWQCRRSRQSSNRDLSFRHPAAAGLELDRSRAGRCSFAAGADLRRFCPARTVWSIPSRCPRRYRRPPQPETLRPQCRRPGRRPTHQPDRRTVSNGLLAPTTIRPRHPRSAAPCLSRRDADHLPSSTMSGDEASQSLLCEIATVQQRVSPHRIAPPTSYAANVCLSYTT